MVEVEHDNTRAIAGTGLGFGVGATALALLQNGGLGGILGGGGGNGNHYVNRYEAEQAAKLADAESRIRLLEANTYVDNKILEMYRYVDGKFNAVESQICAQAVVNAQVAANLSCLQNTVSILSGMTKTVIPIDNICPQPQVATSTTTG